jgi:peptide/nickel transport system substrate-binding protein
VKVQKSKALIAGAAAVALALTGCSSSGGKTGGKTGSTSTGGGGSSSSSKPAAGKGQLVYGESTDFPENLMPEIAAGNSTAVANIEVRLLNGPFKITPAIAYQVDPDFLAGEPTNQVVNGQQVVTYKLNPKAVWDDGQAITAADYVFTWQTLKSADPKTGGCAALLSTTGYDQMQTVDAVDNTTVKVTYQKGKSFPDWQSMFSPLLSKHVLDKGTPKATCANITTGWPIKNGIPAGASNGPWVLKQSDIDVGSKTVTLTPNPKWWGTPTKLARLVDAYVGSDSDTNVKALQNQEVGMIYPQPQLDLVSNLNQLSGVTTEINFGTSFEHLDFNTKYGLLANKAVRQAIAYAIDRPALVAATVGKFSDKASVLGNRLVLSNQKGYEDHSGDYAKQNIAKAKSLLTGAGATMGSNGIYQINGKPLSFTVETTQQNPLRDQTIATMAAQVKAAGIKFTEDADADIFAGADKPHSLEAEGFQIALFAWVGGPAISSNRSIYYTKAKGGGQNYSQISNPTIDSALDKMATATNTDDETKYANVADSALWDQMATLPLYQKPTLLAFNSNYSGIGDNATQAGPLWNSDGFAVKS